MQSPYEEPFKVVSRSQDLKTFDIEIKHKIKTINVNRLKPTFYEFEFTDKSTSKASSYYVTKTAKVRFTKPVCNPDSPIRDQGAGLLHQNTSIRTPKIINVVTEGGVMWRLATFNLIYKIII